MPDPTTPTPPRSRRSCLLSDSMEVIATGKRKTAVARVRMKPGTGQVVVNGRPMTEYFPREVLHMRIQNPFEVAGAEQRWDVAANIKGGGVAGQADALRHGIARALEKMVAQNKKTIVACKNRVEAPDDHPTPRTGSGFAPPAEDPAMG